MSWEKGPAELVVHLLSQAVLSSYLQVCCCPTSNRLSSSSWLAEASAMRQMRRVAKAEDLIMG